MVPINVIWIFSVLLEHLCVAFKHSPFSTPISTCGIKGAIHCIRSHSSFLYIYVMC